MAYIQPYGKRPNKYGYNFRAIKQVFKAYYGNERGFKRFTQEELLPLCTKTLKYTVEVIDLSDENAWKVVKNAFQTFSSLT